MSFIIIILTVGKHTFVVVKVNVSMGNFDNNIIDISKL